MRPRDVAGPLSGGRRRSSVCGLPRSVMGRHRGPGIAASPVTDAAQLSHAMSVAADNLFIGSCGWSHPTLGAISSAPVSAGRRCESNGDGLTCWVAGADCPPVAPSHGVAWEWSNAQPAAGPRTVSVAARGAGLGRLTGGRGDG